jgi:GTPase
MAPRIDRDEQGLPVRVWVSARERRGLELIPQAIAELLGRDVVAGDLVLDPAKGRLRARLYAAGAVISEAQREDGSALLSIKMPALDFQRLALSEQLDTGALLQPR